MYRILWRNIHFLTWYALFWGVNSMKRSCTEQETPTSRVEFPPTDHLVWMIRSLSFTPTKMDWTLIYAFRTGNSSIWYGAWLDTVQFMCADATRPRAVCRTVRHAASSVVTRCVETKPKSAIKHQRNRVLKQISEAWGVHVNDTNVFSLCLTANTLHLYYQQNRAVLISNLYLSLQLCLLLNRLQLCSLTQDRVVLIQLVTLQECYTFRHVLGPSWGISIQKPYKGWYSTGLRDSIVTVSYCILRMA